ncbi:MAG TPA: SUMF1/EgtB/PvdO family nonheme iron enzyme [Ktedonobacterales bacterium]|nr:SUMF1/EgtB/PvdO family nonheme iron enzyme [Ktedonobacterales bacterium]
MPKATATKHPRPKPSVFLSHSRADAAWCQPFIEAVSKTHPVQHHLADDAYEQPQSEAQLQAISEQISTHAVFVVILSPASCAAPHVQQEIDLALTDNRTIIPVVIGDIKSRGRLASRQGVDARQETVQEAARQMINLLQILYGSASPLRQPSVSPPRLVLQAFQALWEPGEARLKTLSFVPTIRHQHQVILPPVCDIPAGPFLMGDDTEDDEAPQFMATTPAFQMATYPLTVAEYACAMQAHVVSEPNMVVEPAWATQLRRLDHPVAGITWEQAVAYAAWLAKLTGEDWHVPTEVEWEKAARGTDGRRYPWGDEWYADRANIDEGTHKTTTAVGSYPTGASPYGCQDMAGNVWEWTTTLYFQPGYPIQRYRYPYDAQDGREDLLMNAFRLEGQRVFRGGDWDSDADAGRTTNRYYPDMPGDTRYYTSVRLACGLHQR